MKTVSITLEDAAWENMQRLARTQGKGLEDLVSHALAQLSVSRASTVPSPEERRRMLDKLWERIDACNVEVGERPTRARTYDDKRLHRY